MRSLRTGLALVIGCLICCTLLGSVVVLARGRSRDAPLVPQDQPSRVTTSFGPKGRVDTSYFENGLTCSENVTQHTGTCTG
jgi:hypothetical protein